MKKTKEKGKGGQEDVAETFVSDTRRRGDTTKPQRLGCVSEAKPLPQASPPRLKTGGKTYGFPRGSVAQLFSGEFLLAYVVFLIAFSLTFILWSNSQAGVLSSEGIYEMEDIGNNVVEQLIRTKGIPGNWTHENVKSIGLANQARILNPNKTVEFIHLMNSSNYEYTKYLLGIGNYNFYFNLTYVNGSTIKINNVTLLTGIYPYNETRKLSIVRTSIMDNSTVRIIFTIWL